MIASAGQLAQQEMRQVRPGVWVDKYDVIHDRRSRRTASVEFREETGKTGMLDDFSFMRAAGIARDLRRNYSQAKAMLWQFQLHVIGRGNCVHFSTDDEEWNEAAAYWYNEQWAMNCDARDDRRLADINGQILLSVLREHDCLAFFDHGAISPGKMWFWESDQICNLTEDDFARHRLTIARRLGIRGSDEMTQESGIVRDRFGRVAGYIVHGGRGRQNVEWKDATVLPRGLARLFKNSWRLNQQRGTSEILTAAANLIDGYEILVAELNAAKTQAKQAMAVYCTDSHQKALHRADSSDGQSAEAALTDDDAAAFRNYRNFELLSAGAIEYLEPGDEVKMLENKRPAPQLETFLSAQGIMAGASMGLPRFFSLLKADASFSAVRGEMNLADVNFQWWQQWAQDYLLDWQLENALGYAFAEGILPARSDWKPHREFCHPKMPKLDENKATQAAKDQLDSDLTTLREQIGPDWRKKVKQRALERRVQADENQTTTVNEVM